MSEEVIITQHNKKKQKKYPFLRPQTEEAERTGSTEDEGESGIRTRKVYYEMKDEIKKANDQLELQKEMLKQKQRETEERLFTARTSLTNSELGNVARVFLSDQTITLGKGRQQHRRHRKIFAGLYHSDQEEITEIELRRAGAEEQ